MNLHSIWIRSLIVISAIGVMPTSLGLDKNIYNNNIKKIEKYYLESDKLP